MFKASVYNILIASPSDIGSARKQLLEGVNQWNWDRSLPESVVLRPLMWEFGASSLRKGSDPQADLNWMVDQADILFAVFNARTGTPTPRARSGTVEEIERALGRGIPVHLMISSEPLPRDIDTAKLEEFRELEQHYRTVGVLSYYDGEKEFYKIVRTALDMDMAVFKPSQSPISNSRISGNMSSRGKLGFPVLRLTNDGDLRITNISIYVVASDGSEQMVSLVPGLVIESKEKHSFPIHDTFPNGQKIVGAKTSWMAGGSNYSQYLSLV